MSVRTKVAGRAGSSSVYCVFRGNLVEQYQQAKVVYTSAIEGAKVLHGKDFYEAQLQVAEAHMGFERAWQDVIDQRLLVH
jgi:hypothetical protein